MPHVDEGTLDAYLDGELPSGERDAVEAHLAQCPTCRARLTDERALVERASALLGSARPLERPAPPLDQLRRAAPARRSPWGVRTSFAWAASIALALGLGYVLRGGGSDNVPFTIGYQTQTSRVAEDHARAAPPPATVERHEEKSALAHRFDQRQRPTPPTDVAAAAEKPRADSAAASGAAAAAGALALKTAPQLRNATSAPVTRQREADSLVAVQRAANSLVTVQEEVVVTAPPPQPSAVLRGRATTTQWPIISRGAARNLLGSDPVGLPGLATRRIRRSPAPDGIVVVEQALDSSTVIEIYQRPADPQVYVDGAVAQQAVRDKAAREAAPAAAAAPADRLARYVGRLRVEIAGPLSPDSLNKLLEQVQPLP